MEEKLSQQGAYVEWNIEELLQGSTNEELPREVIKLIQIGDFVFTDKRMGNIIILKPEEFFSDFDSIIEQLKFV